MNFASMLSFSCPLSMYDMFQYLSNSVADNSLDHDHMFQYYYRPSYHLVLVTAMSSSWTGSRCQFSDLAQWFIDPRNVIGLDNSRSLLVLTVISYSYSGPALLLPMTLYYQWPFFMVTLTNSIMFRIIV